MSSCTPPSLEELPPAVLYKFRRFPGLESARDENRNEVEWIRNQVFETLRNGKLRLAKPNSFNDPFEFRPAVLPITSYDKQTRRRARANVRRLLNQAQQQGKITFKDRLNWVMNPGREQQFVSRLPDFTRQSLERMRDEVVIYCLAGNQARPLLWSHYADGHRGIALHFDATRAPMVTAWRVLYSKDYPEIPALAERTEAENWNLVVKSLLVKDLDWRYEDEFRFVAPLTGTQHQMLENFGVRIDGLDMSINPKVITGLTLGAKIAEDSERSLLDFISSERPDLKVQRGKLSAAKFEIEIL